MMNPLDRNQDGRIDLNDLSLNKNQSNLSSLNGRSTGLASNQPMPLVGREAQSYYSSSSSLPFNQGTSFSSPLPQGGTGIVSSQGTSIVTSDNTGLVPHTLPSSLQKNPSWMNSGNNLERQWNSKFPSGINPRDLQKKRGVHQQLLGMNGNWNLRHVQTPSSTLSYQHLRGLPVESQQQVSSSQWAQPNKNLLHQELLGKHGNWNLKHVDSQYARGLEGSSLRDPNWMSSSQLSELEKKKMAKKEAKAAKKAKKDQKWASLSEEERRIKLAKKEAKREAKAAKKAQKVSQSRSIPMDSTQQSNFYSTSQVRMLPVETERIEKNVVVHEHIHPTQKEEIQPIIYRERDQFDIRQITQQLHETKIQPTVVNQVQLAPEIRPPVVQRSMPIEENVVLPSRDIDNTARTSTIMPAIVNETVRKTLVEEIQPVLERDVIQPSVIKETQPIYEKVIEAPHVQREILPTRELGVSNSQIGRSLTAPFTSVNQMPSSSYATSSETSNLVYFRGPQQNIGIQQGSVPSSLPVQHGINERSTNYIPRMSEFAAEGGSITHAEGNVPPRNAAAPLSSSQQGMLPQQFTSVTPQPIQYQSGQQQNLYSLPIQQQGYANQQLDYAPQGPIQYQPLQQYEIQQRSTIVPPRGIYTQALPQQSRVFNPHGGISQFAAEGGSIAFAQSGGLNTAPIIKTIDANLMAQTARQQPPTYLRQI